MAIEDAFRKGEIVSMPREKAINLLEQLSHTAKQDTHMYLDILLDLEQTGEVVYLDLGHRPDTLIWESYNFFNDVGMLDE